ncbi:MAG: 3-phosphoshikimate 1-carboxyvinyltransferase [Promethearchaeota archaeon]
MRAIVKRSTIEGTVKAPPSKSYTHRAIVCGLLSKGLTRVSNPLISDDTLATVNASRLMGAAITQSEAFEIQGPMELHAPESEIYCQGSGTTLRIFTALAALTKGKCVLTGDKTLQARPVGDLLDGLQQLDTPSRSVLGNGKPPIVVEGRGLKGGSVKIRGDVTSQYITGLLFACSRGDGNTEIEITTHLESRPYVEMTLDVMNLFGVSAMPSETWDHIEVPGSQEYLCPEYSVEGDFSSAAFLLAAGALAGKAKVTGLKMDSVQGDASMLEILHSMGIPVKKTEGSAVVRRSEIQSIDIDASQNPDLVPILSVLSTQAEGTTEIRRIGRLKLKESDRIFSVTQELRKMGASIEEIHEGLRIKGPTPLHGAILDPHDDHRIAMAGVVAGLIADGTTTVEHVECVSKSYPRFIQDMKKIGAQIIIKGDIE